MFICKSNSYIFEESIKNERNKIESYNRGNKTGNEEKVEQEMIREGGRLKALPSTMACSVKQWNTL